MDQVPSQDVILPAPAGTPDDQGLTRRQALGLGIVGFAGAAALASACYRTLCAMRANKVAGGASSAAPGLPGAVPQPGGAAPAAAPAGKSASVFKQDAPTGELWELWQKRGWAREAKRYVTLGRNVQCQICPNRCLLEPGDRSHCRNRVNKGGKLYTLAYGNPCALHVDPIEKKPLFHFLPGSGAFSLATAGCVLRCLNCQNWDISQKKPEETKLATGEEIRPKPEGLVRLSDSGHARYSLFPEDVVAAAEYFQCASIAYTYSEPIAYYEYMYDTARLARARKIRNVWITCGFINEEALVDLCQYLDAANVNLKSFSDDIYRTLNEGALQPILDTLKTLKKNGVWFEVTNLVVPTYTDKPDMMRRMCDWLVKNIGPDYPLHFSRFHPMYKLTHLSPTPLDILLEARDIARNAGLRHVYIGNVRGVEGAEATFCPGCKKAVIERDVFSVTALRVKHGKCESCGKAIPGVWQDA
ncbi:MAG: AmmeMemoRadiSam system radical SAM enzyme [Planctomycetota bacterium]|nr:AmmeMemoRadiSam system radical SAM enzyme [Planctomycetota bacterium]